MGSDGVSEVGRGVGERVDGMVNGVGLALGSLVGSGASGGGIFMGTETSVHSELAEVGDLWIVTEGVQ